MPRLKRSPTWRFAGLFIGVLLLFICLLFSITLGAAEITPRAVWTALFAFDGSTEHLIVTTVRLPRALIALMVGAALAIAGGIITAAVGAPYFLYMLYRNRNA